MRHGEDGVKKQNPFCAVQVLPNRLKHAAEGKVKQYMRRAEVTIVFVPVSAVDEGD